MDAFELAVARHADAAGLPILGICRGAQTLNVARGGTLLQHVPDHRQTEPGWAVTHDVAIESGSLLARAVGAGALRVNSFHHQAVERLGDGLRAVAWAPDGTVEGIEGDDGRFVLGVQWHAETLDEVEQPQARLFGALVEAARESAARELTCAASASSCGVTRRPTGRRSSACTPRSPRAGPTATASGSTAAPGWCTGGWRSSTSPSSARSRCATRRSASRSSSTAASTTTTSCARSSSALGHALPLDLRHRGHPARLASSGARACWTGSRGCSRSRCWRSRAAAACSCATGSGSSRSTSPSCPAAGCAPPRRCRRSSPRAGWTRTSTRSRCTTT